jgi:hypothetical protein
VTIRCKVGGLLRLTTSVGYSKRVSSRAALWRPQYQTRKYHVRAYKGFLFETQTTLLPFKASKLKLQILAKALRIRGGKLLGSHDPGLDEPHTASVIQIVLTSSIKAFDKVEYASTSLRLPFRQRPAGTDGWLLPIDYTSMRLMNVKSFPKGTDFLGDRRENQRIGNHTQRTGAST